MSVVVRPAAPEEAGEVAALYEWLFAPPGAEPPQWDPVRAVTTLDALARSEDGEVLVAEDDGELVGFCTVTIDLRSVRFGLRAWVEDLAVHPGRRSQGTGRALLESARAWASERGATHLELDSGEARADAHRFYRREGPAWESTCFGWDLTR